MRLSEQRNATHDELLEGVKLKGEKFSKDNWNLRHALPGRKKEGATVNLKTDEVEIEQFIGERFIEKKTGAEAVRARCFGYFGGRWVENHEYTFYVEDVPEELLQEHEAGGESASASLATSSPAKQDYRVNIDTHHGMIRFKNARTTFADRITETFAPGDAHCIHVVSNKAGVEIALGCGVLIKSDNTGHECERLVGLVKALRVVLSPAGQTIMVTVIPYVFASLEDPEEYFDLHEERNFPHPVLQTDKSVEVDVDSVLEPVTLVPQCFWERPFTRLPNYYLVTGHVVDREKGGLMHAAHLATSPLVRTFWAEVCLGNTSTAPMVEMLRRSVRLRLEAFLDRRVNSKGCLDAIHLDNIPPQFMYKALGREWISAHERSCGYNAKTRQHELAGSCDDFAKLLGEGVKFTETDRNSGLLVVQSGNGMQEITFRWGPKRPGVLLLVLGGIAFYGPPQPDGSRGDPQWNTIRCSASVRAKRRLAPGSSLVI